MGAFVPQSRCGSASRLAQDIQHRLGQGEEYQVSMSMFAVASVFEAHILPRMQRMVSVSLRLGGRETDTESVEFKCRCNERSSQLANFNSYFNVSQIVFTECSRPSVTLPAMRALSEESTEGA